MTTTLYLFLLFTRSIFSRKARAVYRAERARHRAPSEEIPETPGLPKSATLAGTPIWLLESERADRGALLRENLLCRPSGRDG
jgi:hypothetical protein